MSYFHCSTFVGILEHMEYAGWVYIIYWFLLILFTLFLKSFYDLFISLKQENGLRIITKATIVKLKCIPKLEVRLGRYKNAIRID